MAKKRSRQTKSKSSSRSTVPDLCPDGQAKYQRVVAFFEKILRHSKGQNAGKPFILLPWQHHVMRELFGRLSPDGTRKHRIGYIELPKKQGKSTTLAGIALYMTMFDSEPGAEVYGAASDREQAGIIYREAASMVRSSPALSKHLEVIDSRKTIIHKASGSFYRVLSADAFRAEGLNIHALLFDELHAQRDRRLWDALRYGGAARQQPLLVGLEEVGTLVQSAGGAKATAHLAAAVQARFDRRLLLLAELGAAGAEHLDAVVVGRVVAGRHHQPAGGPLAPDRARHRRRGAQPQLPHLPPGGHQAGTERRHQHRPAAA